MVRLIRDAANGSPPRAWGQPLSRRYVVHPHRFTPTCVGTTPDAAANVAVPAVHPHVRGDNVCWHAYRRQTGGSPPRAWGQRIEAKLRNLQTRFTPTCVGTTKIGSCVIVAAAVHPHVRGDNVCSAPSAIGSAAVHPHVRGDNDRARNAVQNARGSPPRAWGQRCLGSRSLAVARFTPTCVGTTRGAVLPALSRTVHPHVRGDNAPVRVGNAS